MVQSSKSISGIREEFSSSSSSSSGRRRETNIDASYETPQNLTINEILDGGPYVLYIKGLIKTDVLLSINQSFYVDWGERAPRLAAKLGKSRNPSDTESGRR